MALITNIRNCGIDEAGSFTGDHPGAYTDTPWGRTQEDGTALQVATTVAELFSGQSLVQEDIKTTRAASSIVLGFIISELQAFQRAWGVPSAALSGGLSGGTPVAEEIKVTESDMGAREDLIYVEGPGSSTTRTLRAWRAKATDFSGMVFAKGTWHTPGATWALLPDQVTPANPIFSIFDAL